MADVRGASGVPGLLQFSLQVTPTPSTPLYIDLANGDLYANINETVTLIGGVAGSSSRILAEQAFGKHIMPQAILGNASDILQQRAFMPRPLPAMWS